MNHEEAIDHNLQRANNVLNGVQGEQPTQVAIAAATLAQTYMLGALVSAVRELSDEVRQLREAR